MAIAIRAQGVSKQFRIAAKQEPYRTLRDGMAGMVSAPFRRVRGLLRGDASAASDLSQIFWALRDVSFDIQQGEVVGIIGANGAGKSTLLKVLSRITEPSEGKVWVKGRVGSLLEVGTGFHQELTGRENIYLNGAILGMSRQEIAAKFDEIVSFAEVERFVDTPVKHYSSGMYLRLAFAVAAHLETEILLVDEVLAVGDLTFQRKCLGKMGEVANQGRTVLLVSHNMGSIAGLAKKGLLLNRGRVEAYDDVQKVIDIYLDNVIHDNGVSGRVSSKSVYIEGVQLASSRSIDSGETVRFQVDVVSSLEKTKELGLSWFLKNEHGTPLVIGRSDIQYAQTFTVYPGSNAFMFEVGPLPLTEGGYLISLEINDPWSTQLDRLENCLEFAVHSCRLMSEGHSIKTNWGHGSIILPFTVTALGDAQHMPQAASVQPSP